MHIIWYVNPPNALTDGWKFYRCHITVKCIKQIKHSLLIVITLFIGKRHHQNIANQTQSSGSWSPFPVIDFVTIDSPIHQVRIWPISHPDFGYWRRRSGLTTVCIWIVLTQPPEIHGSGVFPLGRPLRFRSDPELRPLVSHWLNPPYYSEEVAIAFEPGSPQRVWARDLQALQWTIAPDESICLQLSLNSST